MTVYSTGLVYQSRRPAGNSINSCLVKGLMAAWFLDTAPAEHTPLHVLQEECWTSQCTHQRAVMKTAPPVLWSKLPRVSSSTPLTSAKKLPSVRRSLLPLKSSTMFFLKSSAFFTPPRLYAVLGSVPGVTSLRHSFCTWLSFTQWPFGIKHSAVSLCWSAPL